ncbi:DJ-1 family glyoxalase III [Scatolibacter rhodanostii]|uniref:DJ-1 family glyoxalase III n=1 Tax=Scatolibacter rhodanostii TaxID=2014781 RepID=UPI000C06D8F1|nr:DJ-1 family glyoxalase III [Scatolibacter rhodanostii]
MVYVFLANGFEEIEALAAVDVLRRVGIPTQTVGIGSRVIYGSHDIPVTTDIDETQVHLNESIQAVILPGGMPGTKNLENSPVVQSAIAYCVENQVLLAAICAAPSILGHLGLLKGKQATAHPDFQKDLKGALLSEESVCRDGQIITAKGMGVSLDFGLKILEALTTLKTADRIRESVQCP